MKTRCSSYSTASVDVDSEVMPDIPQALPCLADCGDQRVSTSALRGFVGSYLIEWVDYVLHDRLCMLATTMYRDKFSFLCPRTGLS